MKTGKNLKEKNERIRIDFFFFFFLKLINLFASYLMIKKVAPK